MLVRAEVNPKYKEIEVHVCGGQKDKKVTTLVSELSKYLNQEFYGQDENGVRTVLNPLDVISFFASGQKVYARTGKGIFFIQKKLYELEEQMDPRNFFRISKSEIINLKKIEKLDMSLSGTIRVILKDGSETYTSRRNVVKLKKTLGI